MNTFTRLRDLWPTNFFGRALLVALLIGVPDWAIRNVKLRGPPYPGVEVILPGYRRSLGASYDPRQQTLAFGGTDGWAMVHVQVGRHAGVIVIDGNSQLVFDSLLDR